jgi:para-aminobenzoate synthetase component 1
LGLANEILQQNPSPYGAYLKLPGIEIASASPELFFSRQGDVIKCSPIKGTSSSDVFMEKDSSENIMIVDLMRNDLTPYAKTGSIHVSEYCKIYSFKHVHQMISTIEATLENEEKAIDAILQCVPAGSMTGAPKKNVMKHIDTFETFKRGMYAGNIGYFDNNGDFDSNVVIRTIYYDEKIKKANFSVGSAITSQSIAIEEYKECLLKAQFILKAFGNE